MAVNYPASVDTFPVPALPEATSLSSAGSTNPGRAHTDHHRDLGLGLTAVMSGAAVKGHVHMGGADGTPVLAQAATHGSVDTDSLATSLHHTLGTGATQAAAGNHTHDYNGPTITGKPYLLCLQSARPMSPYTGLHIFETDTNRERVYCQLPDDTGPNWRLTPGSPSKPCTRLRQVVPQQLTSTGTILEWDTNLEDNFSYWSSSTKTDVVIKEAGLYQIEASIAWNPSRVADEAHVALCQNTVVTEIAEHRWLYGNVFVPNFSQSLTISGKMRFAANDILQVKVWYKQPSGLIGFLLSFIDSPSKVMSRLDLAFIGC